MSGTFVSLHGKLFGIDSETGQVRPYNADVGNGVKTGATVSVLELGNAAFHKTRLTFTATPITVTDDAGQGQYGGAGLIYTFPQGLIIVQGAMVSGVLTMGVTGTFIDTYDGHVALGTITATTGSTLVSTEADIMPSVAFGPATAKVVTIDAVTVAAALTEAPTRAFDGTTTAVPMFLNFLITDDGSHTSGTGVFTGSVDLLWSSVGDN